MWQLIYKLGLELHSPHNTHKRISCFSTNIFDLSIRIRYERYTADEAQNTIDDHNYRITHHWFYHRALQWMSLSALFIFLFYESMMLVNFDFCLWTPSNVTYQTSPMQTRYIKSNSNRSYVIETFFLLLFSWLFLQCVRILCLLEHKFIGIYGSKSYVGKSIHCSTNTIFTDTIR